MYKVKESIAELAKLDQYLNLTDEQQQEKKIIIDYLIYMKAIIINDTGNIEFCGVNAEENREYFESLC